MFIGLSRRVICRVIWLRLLAGVTVGISLLASGGCTSAPSATDGSRVIFLDGAGWGGSHKGVQDGLQAAGFRGHVEVFSWTTLLGPVPDHLSVGRKKQKGKQLSQRIHQQSTDRPKADLHLMGLSAGAAVIVFALEQLPAGVQVDNVVLFAPSISAKYDLSTAMEHVRGYLYATSSPLDGILAGVHVNADGRSGRPAGLVGLRIPSRVKRYDLYARVVNLSWRSAYADLGWNGSHTGATGKRFVQNVIAPRVLSTGPQPLNRPLAPPWASRWRGALSE